jgi:hypothetical protein
MSHDETQMAPHHTDAEEILEFGGLRFGVSLRPPGATLRVSGRVGDEWTEMLRFDDFVDQPHFHVPSSGPSIAFDRSLGDPLAWYVAQIHDHLAEWLEQAGFAAVVDTVDLDAVTRNADRLTRAMEDLVPDGCARVAGVGLQRVAAPA